MQKILIFTGSIKEFKVYLEAINQTIEFERAKKKISKKSLQLHN
ncbi:hypothetical protein SAMN02745883_00443 [Caminicella sporogenes DSM 14501]|uniref:Uncharacterized protein n=1 Tax=Caminicella sporogenes DSM 14501 TaxID=1121266 RepID=A0A1M6M282_9FIRM|nr:hypothetical protein [Caminicella sporogenes]SHJ77551.1 hypothetical protein SAMN02745883_00443 [Caminicella sporogenes DSM 14501]